MNTILKQVLAASPASAVQFTVTLDANTSKTATGFRFGNNAARSLAHHAMQTNVGFSLWVSSDEFENLAGLAGKVVTIEGTALRILSAKIHALGVALLTIGNYEQVTA